MRDVAVIDSELRLLCDVCATIRDEGGTYRLDRVDELLDERRLAAN